MAPLRGAAKPYHTTADRVLGRDTRTSSRRLDILLLGRVPYATRPQAHVRAHAVGKRLLPADGSGERRRRPPAAHYLVGHACPSSGGLALSEEYDYEISNNILVNGHSGISPRGPQKPEEGRRGEKHRIHHNLMQARRIVGWKSPVAVYLARRHECEVYQNKLASDNARGLISDGVGMCRNKIHDNEISARYSTASAIGYVGGINKSAHMGNKDNIPISTRPAGRSTGPTRWRWSCGASTIPESHTTQHRS